MFLCSTSAVADITLPAVFSDHMVLQRDMAVRVFGRAQVGEAVTVTLKDAAGATVRTGRDVAGQGGAFAVMFEPMTAAESPMTLVVEGANTVTINDVLVGDVWVAGGQSNMEWAVRDTRGQAAEAAAAAQATSIRLMKVPHATAYRPKTTVDAHWTVLTPETVADFSAVAFWFARDLREKLGVPIGILSINWGGTRAEPWADLTTLASHPQFVDQVTAQRAAIEAWESVPQAERDAAWRDKWAAFQAAAADWWTAVNGGETPVAPAIDDSAWQAVALPHKWSTQDDLKSWDGSAWYRTTFDVPEAWAGKECVVELGSIDDCDALLVNGQVVANTVSDPSTPRRYRVPASSVKAGPMELAVLIVDLHGEGGMVGGTLRARCPSCGDEPVPIGSAWQFQRGKSGETFPPPPERPARAGAPGMRNTDPGAMYNAMIAPFAGFAVRGAIWYQGESNAGSEADALAYADLLPLVVRSWRAAFERPDLPFGVVSLASFRQFDPEQAQSGIWPVLRNSQLHAESELPNLGVITTIDVGDANDIHPRDKRTVGERLSRWAQSTAYGNRASVWRGPRVVRSRIEDDAVVLEFRVESPPLATRGDEPLKGFAIAGPDGVFYWAEAEIASPTTVRLSSPSVKQPVEVRYAWQDNPANANLIDSAGAAGVPAHPFRHMAGH